MSNPTNSKPVSVKWAASDLIKIKQQNGQFLLVSKAELLSLQQELNSFIEYYNSSLQKSIIQNIEEEF